jgi:hypothetical protein
MTSIPRFSDNSFFSESSQVIWVIVMLLSLKIPQVYFWPLSPQFYNGLIFPGKLLPVARFALFVAFFDLCILRFWGQNKYFICCVWI